jgi:hypothetical protein
MVSSQIGVGMFDLQTPVGNDIKRAKRNHMRASFLQLLAVFVTA